ncbi:hypothetical protein CARUB_v10003461mg [Capsella rubella]|uniref:ENTH domain-containing protein n=1 Tax=Capsella rubella TaxID=81985 RepID=R0H0I7_9BRAS|nr:hypothetical protein CARUB_v10003461mg [Capsella rubella]
MDFMKVFDQTVREMWVCRFVLSILLLRFRSKSVDLFWFYRFFFCRLISLSFQFQKEGVQVLDATDNEPWGPHGTALAEIAQALAVIDYLISNGSERAVDEIIEHTYQISSLTSFEYVEPNGKDVGINVRKKAENIVALLNNKEKISEIRDKAIANRNKYVGLSSTGITYKSGSASASFGGSFQSGSSNYDSYKDRDSREDKNDYESFQKSRRGVKSDEQGFTSKKSFSRYGSTDHDNLSTGKKSPDSAKYSSHVSAAPSNNDDDFDDFDPRGTSSNISSAPPTVDLFASPESIARPEANISKPESMTTPNIVDPFAAVPMDNFDGSDPFGAFTSHSASASTGPQAPNVQGSAANTTSPMSLADSKPQHLQKKDPFQVKSGIWANSLSRGLIDLNLTAPSVTKTTNLEALSSEFVRDIRIETEKAYQV